MSTSAEDSTRCFGQPPTKKVLCCCVLGLGSPGIHSDCAARATAGLPRYCVAGRVAWPAPDFSLGRQEETLFGDFSSGSLRSRLAVFGRRKSAARRSAGLRLPMTSCRFEYKHGDERCFSAGAEAPRARRTAQAAGPFLPGAEAPCSRLMLHGPRRTPADRAQVPWANVLAKVWPAWGTRQPCGIRLWSCPSHTGRRSRFLTCGVVRLPVAASGGLARKTPVRFD